MAVQANPVQMSNFGPAQMTEYMMTNVFYSKFADSLKDGVKLSPSLILKLFLLLSLNEVKPHFSSLIGYLVELIKQAPTKVSFEFLFRLMSFYRRKKPAALVGAKPTGIYKNVEIDVEASFVCAFYHYLNAMKKANKASFNHSLEKISLKNTKDQVYMVKYSGIVLDLDVKMSFTSDISFQLDQDGTPQGGEISISTSSKTKLVDFLPKRIGELVTIATDGYLSIEDMDSMIKSLKFDKHKDIFTESNIIELMSEKHPKLDKRRALVEFCIFIRLATVDSVASFYNSMQAGSKFVFDYNVYSIRQFEDAHSLVHLKRYPTGQLSGILANAGSSHAEFLQCYTEWSQVVNAGVVKKGKDKTEKCGTWSVNLQSDEDFDEVQTTASFLSEVYTFSKRKENRIKVYSIKLKIIENVTEVPNPDYAQWEEKKKLLQDACPEKESPSKELLQSLASCTIPPKTVKNITKEKKVDVTQLNEVFKDIDTLYLRKKDKSKLLNSISQFRDKKDVLKDLGLQNKLNIILWGKYGTGKSTTIQAVASYLAKDIYYLDLQGVKTNGDLQILLEYVNKNVPGSGLIVMEDIDAMTPVVLRRQAPSKEATVSELVNNKEESLSLEFLLNVLQGTLTADGSVFLVTTNHIDHLDPAFIRPGRFDLSIELKPCDHYQINALYQRMMGRPISDKLLKEIPENKYTPAELIYHVKNYIFDNETPDEEILQDFTSSVESAAI